jgi:AraC-like DNA-binding protein
MTLAPDSDMGRGTQDIAAGLLGDVRRSTPGARRDIDHWHDDVEFDLIVSGSASYALDDKVYAIAPGGMIWMVPGQRHKLIRGPNLQMWVVMFRQALLQEGWLEDLAAQPSRVISSHELIDLDRLLSQVAQDSDEPAAYNAGVGYVVMRALRASRDRPSASLRTMHPAVTRALLIMRQDGGASSLSDLAAEAGIAAPYLSRLLVEQTGRGFVDWRNRIRLDRFMQGYAPGANLLNAALDAGFGSYTRFHHIFSELVGCSPSEWVARVDEGKPAPRLGAAAPVIGYRAPGAPMLSARQRWTSLIPMVAPVLPKLLGAGFAERVVAATPREPGGAPDFEALDAPLPPDDAAALVESFRGQDPDTAADYARLLATHDFLHDHRMIFATYQMSSSRLTDLITGLLIMLWSAMHEGEVALGAAHAARRQVEAALAIAPPRLAPAELDDARVALACHFVVLYQAARAARASGDQRLFDAIRAVGGAWGLEVFGSDFRELELTADGFRARTSQAAKARRGALA